MKRTYSVFQQHIAYVLIISLCLQSCGGFSNSFTPIHEEPAASIQPYTQKEIVSQTNIESLIGQELTAQGGHSIRLYQEAGKPKANVVLNTPQGFSKSYEGLRVYVEQGAELAILPQLDTKAQQRRIYLHPAKYKQLPKVIIYKQAGIVGGMDVKKDEGQKDHFVTPVVVKGNINKTRKTLSLDASFQEALLRGLPEGCKLGSAYDNGDCFFDALAQWINIINNTDVNTVKYLRTLCHNFYVSNKDLVDSWVQADYGGLDKGKDEYYMVQYTAEECERHFHGRAPIWGRPWVEGIILCKQLNLKNVLSIEVLKDPETGNPTINYQLTSQNGYKPSISEEEGRALIQAGDIPIIINVQGKQHFVSLLRLNINNVANQDITKRAIQKEVASGDKQEEEETRIEQLASQGKVIIRGNKLAGLEHPGIILGMLKKLGLSKIKIFANSEIDASYMLGIMYCRGIGVGVDHQESVKWFKKSAEKGDVDAQYMLGELYYTDLIPGAGEIDAVKCWEIAASHGHIEAQYRLGKVYYDYDNRTQLESSQIEAILWYGEHRALFPELFEQEVKPDNKKAVEWFKEAAKQGHANAQYDLGIHYYIDTEEKDYGKAKEWLEKAADQGHVEAQYTLGEIYATGKGISQDYAKAVEWFEKAANQGHTKAKKALTGYGKGSEEKCKEAKKDLMELEENSESEQELVMRNKLAELNATGDDTSLLSHGENRHYWYSVSDGMRLLIAIRQQMLHPIFISGREGEEYTAHRENREGVFIADPYHIANFSEYFQDDIARITDKHASNRWCSMPRIIVIPILCGLHWRCIRIEINYENKECSILYDDPYGIGSFPPQEKVRLSQLIKEKVKDLVIAELKNRKAGTDTKKIQIKVKEYEKKIDQQGSYKNSYDCGVVVLSNIKDYAKGDQANEIYANASGRKGGIYSLSPFNAEQHEREIVEIRKRHIQECSKIAGIVIDNSRLKEINNRLTESSKSALEQSRTILSSQMEQKISGLPPIYLGMLFSILEQKMPLKEGENYTDEELNECYNLLLGEETDLCFNSALASRGNINEAIKDGGVAVKVKSKQDSLSFLGGTPTRPSKEGIDSSSGSKAQKALSFTHLMEKPNKATSVQTYLAMDIERSVKEQQDDLRNLEAEEQAGKICAEGQEEGKKQFEKDWEQLEVNYDDSSDEEDTERKVSGYKLLENIEKFKKEHLLDSDPTIRKATEKLKRNLSTRDYSLLAESKEEELKLKLESEIADFKHKYILSFITHAIGLNMLYSKQVAQKYYPLKRARLSQKFTNSFNKGLKEHISKSIQDIINGLFLYGKKASVVIYRDAISIIIEDFCEKEKEFIKELQDLIYQKVRYVLKHEQVKDLPDDLINGFTRLEAAVEAYIESLKKDDYIKMKHILVKKSYCFPEYRKLPTSFVDLDKGQNNHPILYGGLQEEDVIEQTKQSIKSILRDNQFSYESPRKPGIRIMRKHTNKNHRSLNNPASEFIKMLLGHYEKNIKVSNILEDNFILKLENDLPELSFWLFESLIAQEEKKGNNSIIEVVNGNRFIKEGADIKNSNLALYEDILHEFIPLTPKRIADIISKNIHEIDTDKIIQYYLASLRSFFGPATRMTLSNQYKFDFKDGYSLSKFMANLRLCNRSTKRLIRSNNSVKDLILRKQKLSRGCKFPSSVESAIETQEITNQGNRADLVINNGTYEDIYERIENLKRWGNISDKDIAYWVRQTFEGDPLAELTHFNGDKVTDLANFQINEIKGVIVDLTYQLFGTEVVRNPASFVHHNMMLDLIMGGYYTWKEFLIRDEINSPLLPMEIKGDKDKTGAVKCARALHNKYNPFMPYPYEYPKEAATMDDPKVLDLIEREGKLTLQWLIYCAKREDMVEGITSDMIPSIINDIEKACQAWANLDPIVNKEHTEMGGHALQLFNKAEIDLDDEEMELQQLARQTAEVSISNQGEYSMKADLSTYNLNNIDRTEQQAFQKFVSDDETWLAEELNDVCIEAVGHNIHPAVVAHRRKNESVLNLLLEKGEVYLEGYIFGITPLHEFAGKGHFKVVKALLEGGADVNARKHKDNGGDTPLYLAVIKGHTEVVKILLEYGSDVNVKISHTKITALHKAAENGCMEIAKMLLDKGADVNACDLYGDTPFGLAIYEGNLEMVKLLLEYNPNMDIKDRTGDNPLHIAIQSALQTGKSVYIQIIKLLIEKGADINAINKEGTAARGFLPALGIQI